jgi:hypothetical protein
LAHAGDGYRPADPAAKAWREAASLSSFEKTDAPNGHTNGVDKTAEEPVTPEAQRLADLLCYGCLVPFWSQGKAKIDDPHLLLPAHTSKLLDSHSNGRTANLRSEIEEFLL